ncbi:MAG: hypothetical protein GX560_04600 [Deinococcales bacterium]|mgnify:CR=1 FL=1|nr:hypothetical protein [Deinococcales bacterium]
MTTATYDANLSREPQVDNERLLGIYGVIFGFLATFMISIFWSMGAILKATGNGGTIVQLDLQGLWNTLFWAFPFVALGSVVLAVGAFALGRAKEAAGIAALPAIGTVLYYLALVQLR